MADFMADKMLNIPSGIPGSVENAFVDGTTNAWMDEGLVPGSTRVKMEDKYG